MQALKAQFDPTGTLNPGRFLGRHLTRSSTLDSRLPAPKETTPAMAVTEPEITTPHGVTAAESPGLQGFLNERDYEALVKCVHCGLCLNQCPTYRANGLEPDSPRGRLYLIRAVSEGTLPVTDEVVDHLQLCLVCRACETACPSNVQFGQVMEAARHELLQHHSSRKRKVASWLAFRYLFPAPHRLKARRAGCCASTSAAPCPAVLGWARRRSLVPRPLRRLVTMEQLAPPLSERFFEPPTERVPAQGERRYTVGMISGCIMPLAFAPTNEATVRVLTANGCDVILPRAQRCCGALAAHSGDARRLADLARANIDAFEALRPRPPGQHRHQRRRLRRAAQELRPPPAGRPALRRARRPLRREGGGRLRVPRPGRAHRPPGRGAAHGHLPGRLPPGARAEGAQPAPRAAPLHPRPRPGGDAGPRPLLWQRRDLQHRPAGDEPAGAGRQDGERPGHGHGLRRGRQPRLPAAAQPGAEAARAPGRRRCTWSTCWTSPSARRTAAQRRDAGSDGAAPGDRPTPSRPSGASTPDAGAASPAPAPRSAAPAPG